MKAPHSTEATFTRAVIQMARLFGWRVAHFRPARTKDGGWVTPVQGDGKGFPDLVLLKQLRMVVAELKVRGNTVTPEQRSWIAAFMHANVSTFVWTPDDWEQIEKVLGAPK